MEKEEGRVLWSIPQQTVWAFVMEVAPGVTPLYVQAPSLRDLYFFSPTPCSDSKVNLEAHPEQYNMVEGI